MKHLLGLLCAVSLSSWARDYLYLPQIGAKVEGRLIGGLGAAAQEKTVTGHLPIVALFITWTVIGFRHGANWTFIF